MNNTTRETGRTCPACGEGALQPQTELETVEYHGESGEIELRFSVCDTCGADLADAADARQNKRAMNAFKKRVDGLLDGAAIRAFRDQLNLTQKLAAELIGGGEVAFSRYESDDVVQSAAMDTALRLCISSPSNLLTLAQIKGVELPADLVSRVTNNHRDQLVFMTRAIGAHLDRELSVAGNRPARKGRSASDHAFSATTGPTRFHQWGSA